MYHRSERIKCFRVDILQLTCETNLFAIKKHVVEETYT